MRDEERVVMTEGGLALGPVIVAHRDPSRIGAGAGHHAVHSADDFVAFYFPDEHAPTGANVVYVTHGPAPRMVEQVGYTTLFAPRRFFGGVLPDGHTREYLPSSTGLRVLQRYIAGLLTLDRTRLCQRQALLAASAIRTLLFAALLSGNPQAEREGKPRHPLGSRRRATLLDKAVVHIDANLQAPLSIKSVLIALGCSRSALYRATAEEGGVAELILNRRLFAIGTLLRDPAERRPIAVIAKAHGLTDPSRFNRRFKTLFGLPPGVLRTGGGVTIDRIPARTLH